MPFRSVDLLRVRTYPLPYCQNRAALENLLRSENAAAGFPFGGDEGLAGALLKCARAAAHQQRMRRGCLPHPPPGLGEGLAEAAQLAARTITMKEGI
jgi:hypothetical protein